MLRASAVAKGEDADLVGIGKGAGTDSGVLYGAALFAFAEAALGQGLQTVEATREVVRRDAGEAAMVDAAGVIANFQCMVPIADGTGIPLD
ncbi:MAG: hypothetical protein ACI8Z1_000109 [Candidatus Azotimanducaceae bacterium]|jgi:hypothetical protein